MEAEQKIFIEWIRQQMKEKQWEQKDLANALELHPAAVSRLFSGKRKLDKVTRLAICQVFNK